MPWTASIRTNSGHENGIEMLSFSSRQQKLSIVEGLEGETCKNNKWNDSLDAWWPENRLEFALMRISFSSPSDLDTIQVLTTIIERLSCLPLTLELSWTDVLLVSNMKNIHLCCSFTYVLLSMGRTLKKILTEREKKNMSRTTQRSFDGCAKCTLMVRVRMSIFEAGLPCIDEAK